MAQLRSSGTFAISHARSRNESGRKHAWFYSAEHCEPRRLLAVALENVPSWVEQGPGPITGGQTEGLPDNPVTGAVEAIAVRPGSSNTVLIGTTNGGVWRTNDITASPVSWAPLTDQMPSLAISSIAFSPFDNLTVFAGTGNFSNTGRPGGQPVGILRSGNGGNSWSLIGTTPFAGDPIRKVIPAVQILNDGTRRHVVLVASGNGLFRSQDGGDSFSLLSGANGLPGGSPSDIVADPSVAGIFYTGIPGTGVFFTNNFGSSWNRIDTNGITGIDAANSNIELAFHFNATDATKAVYAGIIRNTGTPAGPRLASVFRSLGTSSAWTAIGTAPAIHPGGQGLRNFSIVADPVDRFTVYVGGDRQAVSPFVGNLFRGNASSNTWTTIVRDGANGTAPHADSRAMVFVNNDILEADDGGICRLSNAIASNRRWLPLVGNLRLAQFGSVGYDPVRNRILGGMQDTGAADQNNEITAAAADRFRWNQMLGLQGDGGFVDVDLVRTNLVGGIDPIRYAASNQMGFFQRIGAGDFFPTFIGMNIAGGGGRHLTDEDRLGNRVFDTTLPIATPMVLNRIRSERLIIGSNFLYESTNRGDDLTVLGGALTNLNNNNSDDDNDGQIDEGDEFTPPTGGNIGRVTAMAFGGRSGGNDFPNALYVGTATAPLLRFRATGTGLPGALASYPGSTVRDITFEAPDFRSVYVVDNSNRIWRGTNIGITGEIWQNITGNLVDPGLDTIELVGTGLFPIVMAGGVNGIYRLDPNADTFSWTEFGAGLPNAAVIDLRWNPQDDVLLAGTNGRGAWTIRNVSNFTGLDPVLRITGTSSADAAVVAVDSTNPTLINVALNGVLSTFQTSLINRIAFSGGDGSDSFALNFTGGALVPPAGIQFDGGIGSDSVLMVGGHATRDVYFADPESDDSTSLITFDDGRTLTIDYHRIQVVKDEVPTDQFIVTATTMDNNVTLDDGQATFDGRLRVQMSTPSLSFNYASIEFMRKVDVVVNADPSSIIFGGDDSVRIGNTEAAFEQESLTVLARIGDDTIDIGGTFVPTTVSGFSGDDTIGVGSLVIGSVNNIPVFLGLTLTLIDAPLFIDGGSGSDALAVVSTNTGGGATAEITSDAITGLGMAASGIGYDGMQSLTLSTSALSDSIRVRSTGTPLTINTGSGGDLVRLGSLGTTTSAGLGNVNSIFSVTVNGGDGTDSLVLDDSGETVASTFTVTSSTSTGMGSVTRDSVETIITHLGSAADTVLIRSFAAANSLIVNGGGGSDLVRLGSLGSTAVAASGLVNDIDGQISVSGSIGADSIVLDDSGDTAANSATVNTSSVNGLGMLAGVSFSSVEAMNLFTGSGNDTVTNNVAAGSSPTVVANLDGGEDGLIVPATGAGADIINVGWDFLAFPGIPCTFEQAVNNTVPHREVLVATVNGVTYRTEYTDGETIFVVAGNGSDRVTTGTIAGRHWKMEFDGGNGNDTLTGGEREDLLAGGSGNDCLAGGAGADYISGGKGDDLLFGDDGSDTLEGQSGNDHLTGGAGEDLLIGGSGQDSFFALDGAVDRLDTDAGDLVIERDPFDVLL